MPKRRYAVRDYNLLGRRRIYTNEKEITRDNILDVLNHAKAIHDFNVKEMQFLIEYERGKQDLQRTKTIRPEIDIRVHSNIANDIKEFKVGYNWSNPIMLIQRGDNEIHETDPEKDDKGIAALNEALKNGSNIGYEDQCLAESIEVCGIDFRPIKKEPRLLYRKSWLSYGTLDFTYLTNHSLNNKIHKS